MKQHFNRIFLKVKQNIVILVCLLNKEIDIGKLKNKKNLFNIKKMYKMKINRYAHLNHK